jgi:hypothetical protein
VRFHGQFEELEIIVPGLTGALFIRVDDLKNALEKVLVIDEENLSQVEDLHGKLVRVMEVFVREPGDQGRLATGFGAIDKENMFRFFGNLRLEIGQFPFAIDEGSFFTVSHRTPNCSAHRKIFWSWPGTARRFSSMSEVSAKLIAEFRLDASQSWPRLKRP